MIDFIEQALRTESKPDLLLTDDGTRGDEIISQKILEYNTSDGKVLGGLTKRRQAEAKLFTQGYD